MAKNLPKLMRDAKSQTQEDQRIPSRIKKEKKKNPSRIIFKLQKTEHEKEKP